MRTSAKSLLTILHVGIAGALGTAGVQAQVLTMAGEDHIALKSNESQEVSEIFYQVNCTSLLKSPPRVEIVEGPPGVTAELKEAMVLPRFQKCAAPIKGAKLVLSVKAVEDPSFSQLTLRIVYDTRDGERKLSHIYNLSLFP
jgi:hypothetical protein